MIFHLGFKVEVLVSAIHALRAGEKKYPKPIFLLEETSIPREAYFGSNFWFSAGSFTLYKMLYSLML